MLLGHEVVGRVLVAAADGSGPGSRHRGRRAPGDARAGRRHRPTRPTARTCRPGCTYLGSAARFPHTEGAFARYAMLPARMLRDAARRPSLRDAALVEPAAWPGTPSRGPATSPASACW